jgi:hypothetical protein
MTAADPGTARILVVATRTADSDALLEALLERARRGPACFTLLVPATPHGWAWLADMYSAGDEGERLRRAAVERLRGAGLALAGSMVGDPDPLGAVHDATFFGTYDEVVVSTLPRHLSRWLRLCLPFRVQRMTGLPVTHVVATPREAPRPAPAVARRRRLRPVRQEAA